MPDSPTVQTLLGLRVPPIAIGYFDAPPPGVRSYQEQAVPAGCMFWQFAQAGNTFYTAAPDHANCAVGAYTHNLPLPPERSGELQQTIGQMIACGYLTEGDVPVIPRLPSTPTVIAYAPADAHAFAPSVVIVAAQPAQAMILLEAAQRAGVAAYAAPILSRPGCAVEPQVVTGGAVALSLGCMGNRTFTNLQDGELYLAVPGARWAAVAAALVRVAAANSTMLEYYERKL